MLRYSCYSMRSPTVLSFCTTGVIHKGLNPVSGHPQRMLYCRHNKGGLFNTGINAFSTVNMGRHFGTLPTAVSLKKGCPLTCKMVSTP